MCACDELLVLRSRGNSQTLKTLVTFSGTGGAAVGFRPTGGLLLSGTTLFGTTSSGGANGSGSIFSVGISGANYRNLLSFTGTGGTANGAFPHGILAFSGTTLYGMTEAGGASKSGNIFSIGTSGSGYQNLLAFTGGSGTANGLFPLGSLSLVGTTLYGMTEAGGTPGNGNIISAGTNGAITKIYFPSLALESRRVATVQEVI